MPFGLFEDGVDKGFVRSSGDGLLEISPTNAGENVEYKLSFSTLHNPVFKGMKIEDDGHLAAPQIPLRPLMVAIGDSISSHRVTDDDQHQRGP